MAPRIHTQRHEFVRGRVCQWRRSPGILQTTTTPRLLKLMLCCLYLQLLNKFCIVLYFSDKAHLFGLAYFSTDGQLDISSRTLVLHDLFRYLCIPLRERILSDLAIKFFLLCFWSVFAVK